MKLKHSLPFLALLFVATSPLLAHEHGHDHAHKRVEHGAHVHGQASLALVVEAQRVTLLLDSPLDNLLGFEHAPRSLKEKQAIEAMMQRLRQPENLFNFSPAAQCQPLQSELAPLYQAGGSGHQDLQAEYVFACAQTPRTLEVQLFKAFPRLKQVEAQLVGPEGQKSQRLTPGKARLDW